MASRRRKNDPNVCGSCGRSDLVDAIDNYGMAYKGCAHCRISLSLPDPIATARAEGFRAGIEAAAGLFDEEARRYRKSSHSYYGEDAAELIGEAKDRERLASRIRALAKEPR